MITHFEVIADGVVQVFVGESMVAQVSDQKTLDYVMNMYGLADKTEIKCGNGFINDDIIGIYNWETNGVAG